VKTLGAFARRGDEAASARCVSFPVLFKRALVFRFNGSPDDMVRVGSAAKDRHAVSAVPDR